MAAFLASAEGDLVERARLWAIAEKEVREQKKFKDYLAGGSKNEQTKNEGAVE